MFPPYLDEWEQSVKAREGFSNSEKKKMLLSQETLLGLRMTGMCSQRKLQNLHDNCFLYLFTVLSFIELVPSLFKIPGVKAFLSERISQDPLEKFFGCQRQRGGRHENPNVLEFSRNTQALRVIDSFCTGMVKGNCRGHTSSLVSDKENVPLRRCHRQSKN